MEKRTRSTSPQAVQASEDADVSTAAESAVKRVKMSDEDVDHMTEERAGMSQYINPSLPAFEGIIKQRFTDFMVNEITAPPENKVCRITSILPPDGKYLRELKRVRGELEPEEQDKEDERKKAEREAKERNKAVEDEHPTWPESADERLSAYFSPEAIEQMRKLWEEGRNPPPPPQTEVTPGTESQPAQEETSTGEEKPAESTPQDVKSVAPKPVADPRRVLSRPLGSKPERTQSHALIRELFSGRLASESITLQSDQDDEDARANAGSGPLEAVTAIAVRWGTRSDRRSKDYLDEEALNSPPYIHFLLQKTNRDHQEAMVLLSQALGLAGPGGGGRGSATKDLSIAGTKDKRAVTVQRVALRRGRKTLSEVWRLVNGVGGDSRGGGRGRGRGRGRDHGRSHGRGKTVQDAVESRGEKGLRIAQLEYASEPLKLGQLAGNEFTIVLRNVKVPDNDETIIHRAMETIRNKGFVNYYGMQRFGTGAIPTHEFGVLIFKGEYQRAIELLMQERKSDSTDMAEAKQFYREGKLDDAWLTMPRNCIAEKAVLDKMRRKNWTQGDWLGAFSNIPRTLRLMYVHAFQSYIWNRMVSERIKKFGVDGPAEGDVVLLNDDGKCDEGEGQEAENDQGEDEEDAGEPTGPLASEAKPLWTRQAKVLTEEDVRSGQYTIHDVVIPLPGSDITLPSGWMSEMYDQLLADHGLMGEQLTLHKQKEYELRGSYRKAVQRAQDFNYNLVRYTDPDVALTVADEDVCLGWQPEGGVEQEGGEFLALKLNFKLPSSAYATMLLREALKSDTSSFRHRMMTQNSEDQAFKSQQGSSQNQDRLQQRGGGRGRSNGRGRGRGRGGGGGGGRSARDVNSIVSSTTRTWGAPKADGQ